MFDSHQKVLLLMVHSAKRPCFYISGAPGGDTTPSLPHLRHDGIRNQTLRHWQLLILFSSRHTIQGLCLKVFGVLLALYFGSMSAKERGFEPTLVTTSV